MTGFASVLRAAVRSVLRATHTTPRTTQRPEPADVPGRSGQEATVEIEPGRVGQVRMAYVPSADGNPDPGEIVWTWVPFEERDGRGKDRPVLLVATEPAGTSLAVQLTSRPRGGDTDFVAIGRGPWDGQSRESWVHLARVFRVHPGGMRREAAALGREAFEDVAGALRSRYGWH